MENYKVSTETVIWYVLYIVFGNYYYYFGKCILKKTLFHALLHLKLVTRQDRVIVACTRAQMDIESPQILKLFTEHILKLSISSK